MTKKELCKILRLKRPWMLDQWIACGKMQEPELDARGWRIYTEEHYKQGAKMIDNIDR